MKREHSSRSGYEIVNLSQGPPFEPVSGTPSGYTRASQDAV